MKLDTVLVDRYQIREQLSRKPGRQTFLVEDLQTHNLVVIKILRFDADFQWDDLKLFEREASTLQNLSHSAIPEYLDYFDVETADIRGFALVQTYIEAPSLESVVKAGRKFSEAEVMELADRLLSILTYLHGQNPPVIHRDIKPSNILLTNRSGNSIGDVYLVDFGSVQTAASKDGGTITIVGSYGYMPLEQFGGQTTVASDLYSLGMTIIYLLTGTHPAELPQANGQVKFTAEISSKFRRWLEKITQPHLEKRFDSAQSAQISLKSEDGSYGDFLHLKPSNSKVELYRDRDKLEIRWRDIDQEKVRKIHVLLGLPAMLLPWLFVLTPISMCLGNIFPALWAVGTCTFFSIFFIAFAWIPIATILSAIIKILLKEIDYILAIDGQNIYYAKSASTRHKIKILSQHQRSANDILAYNPGYMFDEYYDGDAKTVSRGTVTVDPRLYLYCGDVEHDLSRSKFSQAELLWLGKELSDFLNLELQVIYPTPKVPPAPSCGGGC